MTSEQWPPVTNGHYCWVPRVVIVHTVFKIQVLFGGGLQNFKLKTDGGKRLDTDLVDVWKEKKKEKGDDAQVLFNTGDLKSWTESDYVLGEISMHFRIICNFASFCRREKRMQVISANAQAMQKFRAQSYKSFGRLFRRLTPITLNKRLRLL